jgi:hypothetical protein
VLILLSLVTSEEKNTRALVSYCFNMPRLVTVVIHFLHICNVCTLWRFTTIAKRLEEVPVTIS